jgi:hypothetical protein
MSPGTYRMQTWDESLGAYTRAPVPTSSDADEAWMQAVARGIDADERAWRSAIFERHMDIVLGEAERSIGKRESEGETEHKMGREVRRERKVVVLSSIAARRFVVDLLVQKGGEEWRAELEAMIRVVGEEDEQGGEGAVFRAGLKRCVENVKRCLRTVLGRK